jgi:hypothetical protein
VLHTNRQGEGGKTDFTGLFLLCVLLEGPLRPADPPTSSCAATSLAQSRPKYHNCLPALDLSLALRPTHDPQQAAPGHYARHTFGCALARHRGVHRTSPRVRLFQLNPPQARVCSLNHCYMLLQQTTLRSANCRAAARTGSAHRAPPAAPKRHGEGEKR